MKNLPTYDSAWCYSIYGDDTLKYYRPMRENIRIAKEHGATLVLHTNGQSETKVKAYFEDLSADMIFVVHRERYADRFPKVLRFLTPRTVTAKFYFFKDSDSIVNQKELDLMDQWTRSGNPTSLIIRDHPLHIYPILAGMFGINRELSLRVAASAEACFVNKSPARYHRHCYDQDWLAKEIYPALASEAAVRTSFFYFRGEHFVRTGRDLESYQYIGAQAYKDTLEVAEEGSGGYLRLYGDGLLCLPYYPKLYFLYGKVRPTLAAAYLLSGLKRMRLYF
jgi:hypothetical protein